MKHLLNTSAIYASEHVVVVNKGVDRVRESIAFSATQGLPKQCFKRAACPEVLAHCDLHGLGWLLLASCLMEKI
jgi:hypothetical protein